MAVIGLVFLRRFLAWVPLALGVAACSSTVRVPPGGSAPTIDPTFAPVDYPPPPAQVEKVSADPGEPCVWQDGYWTWSGRRWEWTAGKWVHAPDGCYRVQPRLLYPETEGEQTLLYAPPGWYRESEGAVSPCTTPNDCLAR
jgi:hypothetical protein